MSWREGPSFMCLPARRKGFFPGQANRRGRTSSTSARPTTRREPSMARRSSRNGSTSPTAAAPSYCLTPPTRRSSRTTSFHTAYLSWRAPERAPSRSARSPRPLGSRARAWDTPSSPESSFAAACRFMICGCATAPQKRTACLTSSSELARPSLRRRGSGRFAKASPCTNVTRRSSCAPSALRASGTAAEETRRISG